MSPGRDEGSGAGRPGTCAGAGLAAGRAPDEGAAALSPASADEGVGGGSATRATATGGSVPSGTEGGVTGRDVSVGVPPAGLAVFVTTMPAAPTATTPKATIARSRLPDAEAEDALFVQLPFVPVA